MNRKKQTQILYAMKNRSEIAKQITRKKSDKKKKEA